MRHLLVVLSLLLSTAAIKVQVGNKKEATTETILVNNDNPTVEPAYYESDDTNIDSYLVPPDPHKLEDVITDDEGAPATVLLPPLPEAQVNSYYAPQEKESQSDWYPIAQAEPLLPQLQPESIPIYLSGPSAPSQIDTRTGKQLHDRLTIPVPSRQLEPPPQRPIKDYGIPIISDEYQLPAEVINKQFRPTTANDNKLLLRQKNPLATKIKLPINFLTPEPTLSLELTPPKPPASKYKNPTKLYPKKYVGGFQPIPIPIAQFAEDPFLEVPLAKPAKPFTPSSSSENDYLSVADEKKIYNYEQLEQKRKIKENDEISTVAAPIVEEVYRSPTSEPSALESNQGYQDRNVYAAPLKQEPVQSEAAVAPPPGDRTEFRMHGMNGPHSYQFGYDTGKGKNRQFRYEERDNEGHVRGHYGYMDRNGKLRVVNYDAHPELGFHAEAPVVKE